MTEAIYRRAMPIRRHGRWYRRPMARSRAVVVALAAVLLGSAAVGWLLGGVATRPTLATVVDTLDGDTIVVRVGGAGDDVTVRLLGVDTPETHHPDKPVQCFGPEAAAYTRSRLSGREVELSYDVERRDFYDRTLAFVSVDGERFNDELLRLGYARMLVVPPNGQHARAMLSAMLDARNARRGLWATCE
jgi:micrococcal nuclease